MQDQLGRRQGTFSDLDEDLDDNETSKRRTDIVGTLQLSQESYCSSKGG